MYKIKQIENNDEGTFAKVHFASNYVIATSVSSDLEARFGKMEIEEYDHNRYVWDPGGMLVRDDEIFSFDLGDISVCCRAQHFFEFIGELEKLFIRDPNINYLKIRGAYTCMCLSNDEFDMLINLTNDSSLIVRANNSLKRYKARIEKLNRNNYVVTVVKDENGNVVQLKDDDKTNKYLN